ncbi:lysine-2,3-aminomutase-like protein [Aristophania vespae]|uniref:Lysine-2,3-aminomutase-like protein n=1 Tax=Aristophania vespae TaxID=2697033 RepID=A0A6P1NH04_9PROT|nr:lysine-2,3-aminomutase-like protein [Aristophania vespae]QHI95794.1 lysine-2,3-aminomutase-like protein [Aristophania vespae]
MEKTAKPSLQSTIRSAHDLIEAGLASESDRTHLETVAQHYATAVPPAFQALIEDPNDPIGKQVIPTANELITQNYEMNDPIGDEAFSPLPGLIHRYEDRVLLKPLLICPLYCRFCFRREHVGPDGGLLNKNDLTKAFEWIDSHPEIQEVILSGGDPLMLSPRRLSFIISHLSSITHIHTIRIHTRVPVAAPELINHELLQALDSEKAVWMVLHINHAQELGPSAKAAIKSLVKEGIPLLSQSVLLRGINDNLDSLETLLRSLIQLRIKPYYLHHLDPAPGTSHFHVPVEKGLALLKALRGRVSGLAWPHYVVDIPGGKGKVPLGPSYLLPKENSYNGEEKIYSFRGDIHNFR